MGKSHLSPSNSHEQIPDSKKPRALKKIAHMLGLQNYEEKIFAPLFCCNYDLADFF